MQRNLFKLANSLILFCTIIMSGCNKSNYQDLDGNSMPKEMYQGKWIILNYWANWCGPCRAEIPELNAFYAAHKNKDAVVFGINYDHLTKSQLMPIIQQFAIAYPMLGTDPASKLGINNVSEIPATFFISPAGKVYPRLIGPQTRASLEATLNKISK